MTSQQTDLPRVLAGPLLRRVTPDRMALWMVLDQRYDITVLVRRGEGKKPLTRKPDVRYLQAGTQCWFAFITLDFKSPLPDSTRIGYSILLNGEDICEDLPDLRYDGQAGLFFQVPSKVSALLHGSCRKPHHDSVDGLVEADDLLARITAGHNPDEVAWPAALVMSGDQIYSDDVAGPTLMAIHQVIQRLGLFRESFEGLEVPAARDSDELYAHPDSYYGRVNILPEAESTRKLLDMLFDGARKPVFTTQTANNHLISLAEHLAMYLLVWSPACWSLVSLEAQSRWTAEQRAVWKREKPVIEHFAQGLGQVRRLMAHVPVAMIFDDHDVTDDWNLNREWEEAVYGHPFSNRMVGNALMAYWMCQAWGNAPENFGQDWFRDAEIALKEPGGDTHTSLLTHILRFEGWEYTWECDPPLIVLDTRTRRWRSESSLVKPAGLLDWEALIEAQQSLQGRERVLLVASAPIFGVKLIEVIQRIFTWFGKPLVVDAENWMSHPGTANSILNIFRHKKTPQTFVILSGDVHYSFVYDVELKGRAGGPDIWQICSSGLRNEFPKKLLHILDVLNRYLYSPRSPLNWFTRRRKMRIIPRRPEGSADGSRVLNGSGVGLVELDEGGKPWRVRQIVEGGTAKGFERMERHERWE